MVVTDVLVLFSWPVSQCPTLGSTRQSSTGRFPYHHCSNVSNSNNKEVAKRQLAKSSGVQQE